MKYSNNVGKKDLIGFIEEYKIKNLKGILLVVSPLCDYEVAQDLELNFGSKYRINDITDSSNRKINVSSPEGEIYGIESGYFVPYNPKIREKYYSYVGKN